MRLPIFCLLVVVATTLVAAPSASAKIVIDDIDSRPHWDPDIRVGKAINLWCATPKGSDQTLFIDVHKDGRKLASERISCPYGVVFLQREVIKARTEGLYRMSINGGGYEDYVIRRRAVKRPDR